MPSTSTRRAQNFSFAHTITIQPSAVRKFWNGTIDGCAEYGSRAGTYVLSGTSVHAATYVSMFIAVSKSEVSQSQPRPSRRAACTPASSASAATSPPP